MFDFNEFIDVMNKKITYFKNIDIKKLSAFKMLRLKKNGFIVSMNLLR